MTICGHQTTRDRAAIGCCWNVKPKKVPPLATNGSSRLRIMWHTDKPPIIQADGSGAAPVSRGLALLGLALASLRGRVGLAKSMS